MTKPEPYQQFYDHIKAHLDDDQVVVCKICGKTYEEIVKEDKNDKHRKPTS